MALKIAETLLIITNEAVFALHCSHEPQKLELSAVPAVPVLLMGILQCVQF